MKKINAFVLSVLFVVVCLTTGFATMMAAPAPVEPKEGLKIGMIVPTLGAQFWANCVDFAKKGAEELGFELVVFNADNKADQINKYIEDAIASGIDGLIFVPYWSAGRKAVMDCQNAGIPIITMDCFIDDIEPQTDFSQYIAFIGPNDEDSGYKMAKALFEATPKAADGKKYVGVVQGTPGTTVAINREKGFDRALAEESDVVVVGRVNGNFVREESQSAMEDLYQAHPEITGIWAANGGTATGVMTALKNAGKVPGKDVIIVAMDLNPENVEAVAKGELLYDIGGHWLQGGFAVVMMYDYLNGFPIPEDSKNIVLDLLPLTIDKIDQFNKDFPGGLPTFDFKNASKVYNPDATGAYFEMKYSE
ncbi:MAG: ABC transporter substrate-binding protein [Flexilinea sp.]|jgi:ABC-type sugar transport system substrate-binding protein